MRRPARTAAILLVVASGLAAAVWCGLRETPRDLDLLAALPRQPFRYRVTTADGVVEGRRDVVRGLSDDRIAAGGNAVREARTVGGSTWVREAGGPWERVWGPVAHALLEGADPAAAPAVDGFDVGWVGLSTVLRRLGTVAVTEVGAEEVDGVATTRWRAGTVDVWLDGQGRLRRLEDGRGAVVEVGDIGVALEVEPPGP